MSPIRAILNLAAFIFWLSVAGNAVAQVAAGVREPTPAEVQEITRLQNAAYGAVGERRYAEADELLRRVLAIDQRTYGENHPYTARTLTEIGGTLEWRNDIAAAENLFRKALAINEARLAPADVALVENRSNLGRALIKLGHDEEALSLFQKVYEVQRVSQGEAAQATVETSLIIGDVLDRLHRLEDAETLARRTANALEAKGALATPLGDKALNKLASVLAARGDLAGAEAAYRRILQSIKVRDDKTADVAGLLAALGRLHFSLGRTSEAASDYAQILELSPSSLPAADPRILEARVALAGLAVLLGDPAKALASSREVLAQQDLPAHWRAQAQATRGAALVALGRSVEAEQSMKAALKELESQHQPESETEFALRAALIGAMEINGHVAEALSLLEQNLKLAEALGDRNKAIATLAGIATVQGSLTRLPEAEASANRALSLAQQQPNDDRSLIIALDAVASSLANEGRYAEAEPIQRRSLVLAEPSGDAFDQRLQLIRILVRQYRYDEAEQQGRLQVAAADATFKPGSLDANRVVARLALADVLLSADKPSEAEPVIRSIIGLNAGSIASDTVLLSARLNLAQSLNAQKRYSEAATEIARARQVAENTLPKDHSTWLPIYLEQGRAALGLKRTGEAAAAFSQCLAIDVGRSFAILRAECAHQLIEAKFGDSQWGPGAAGEFESVFVAAQEATRSAAGEALAQTAARVSANSAGAGALAQRYEGAVAQRDSVREGLAKAAASGDPSARQRLLQNKAQLDQSIEADTAELKARAPLYFEILSPRALAPGELAKPSSAAPSLLHDDEAVILFLIRDTDTPAYVFALSNKGQAWARLKPNGREITEMVAKLRSQIDPEGYPVRGLRRVTERRPATFDRRLAYELYQALLGDVGVQRVVAAKSTLIFVPSGALVSLPFGVLVTTPPAGGPAADTDPDELRKTDWLLRSKAVAVAPSVASLRFLRVLRTQGTAATDPLFAIADPDFGGDQAEGPKIGGLRSPTAGAVAGLVSQGQPLADILRSLPRLVGTRQEAIALKQALGGSDLNLLLGRDATEQRVKEYSQTGGLARAAVIEIATHGLVSGDGALESSLALARPAAGVEAAVDDGLLTEGEVVGLRLNAEWAILSACNTASGGRLQNEGVSGMARAFFYAGARSVLVSQWRVRDDVPAQLVPDLLRRLRANPSLSRAQALRQASLAVLDSSELNATDPAAWGVFTLIGEAGL